MRLQGLALGLLCVITACSSGGNKNQTENEKGQKARQNQAKAQTDQGKTYPNRGIVDKTNEGDTVKVTVHTPGNTLKNMRYDLDELKIKAGQTVQLTLVNPAPKNADEMEHNWVVTKAGKDQQVAAKGVKAGEENNFLPEDKSNILAYTPIVKQQNRTTITFSIDKAGEYPFICTHPEHYPTMKGTLTVVGSKSG
jgi:azurin